MIEKTDEEKFIIGYCEYIKEKYPIIKIEYLRRCTSNEHYIITKYDYSGNIPHNFNDMILCEEIAMEKMFGELFPNKDVLFSEPNVDDLNCVIRNDSADYYTSITF